MNDFFSVVEVCSRAVARVTQIPLHLMLGQNKIEH